MVVNHAAVDAEPERMEARTRAAWQAVSDRVYAEARADAEFYRQFLVSPAT
jgi:hypothetical protein